MTSIILGVKYFVKLHQVENSRNFLWQLEFGSVRKYAKMQGSAGWQKAVAWNPKCKFMIEKQRPNAQWILTTCLVFFGITDPAARRKIFNFKIEHRVIFLMIVFVNQIFYWKFYSNLFCIRILIFLLHSHAIKCKRLLFFLVCSGALRNK